MSRLFRLDGVHLRQPGSATVAAALEVARDLGLTYPHDGSTLENAPPGVPDRVAVRFTPGTISAARATLRAWATHDGIAAKVFPADTPPEPGGTFVVVAPIGPLTMVAPTRIVAIVDEPDRFGLAYGTLPGHPVSGEELFLAEQVGEGRLRLMVRVQASPASWAMKLGAPFVTWFSDRAARRYLDSWSSAISNEAGSGSRATS